MSELAILGGTPVRRTPFPPHPIGERERRAVLEVLDSGVLSGFPFDFLGGPKVQAFERKFTAACGSRYAIAVNSGTAALHLAIAALGIGPGDEVIVPCYTFTATSTAVLHQHAIPVFADVDPRTFCVTPATLEAAFTPRTKAIIVVHLLGNMCRMDAILALAKRRGIALIEDTAQAIGARFQGRLAGTMGDAGTFSFVQTKNMVTGEGGMVVTDQEEVAQRCRLVRNHGECYVAGAPRSYASTILGWNYRMTELEAAIGIAQLSQLDAWTEQRIANGEYLNAHLRVPGLTTPHREPDVRHIYHVYSLLYDEDMVGVPRELFQRALLEEGIPLTLGYPHPLYRNRLFQERAVPNYRDLMLPTAEALCRRTLWTNVVRPPATLDDMADVVRAMEKVYEGRHALRELSAVAQAKAA
ncbi:MAG: DegT/DnrJ/EryC1/StrS family aminotransferase [Candidatus Omnitrophica bacterium]|nr:DegT/DnrJ/EryC1/StrS family aminotransferase [Candidatus Omnitrophota bacterium]